MNPVSRPPISAFTRLESGPEGSAVTLLDEEPVETGGYVWVKVRTAFGELEGWVAQDFLITSENP